MQSPQTQISASMREKQLSVIFMEEILNLPGGEHIKECIQCGTCSASCPTAAQMDYSPRQIIAALRAGQLNKVLESNTIWFCTSCYSCTVRCPSEIKITEMMYALKNMAIDFGFAPKKAGSRILYSTFVNSVNKTGRLHEMGLMVRVYLKTDFTKLLKMGYLGVQLFLKRRMSLTSEKIRDIHQLQTILEDLRVNESPRELK